MQKSAKEMKEKQSRRITCKVIEFILIQHGHSTEHDYTTKPATTTVCDL